MNNSHNCFHPSCRAFHILLRVNIGWYMIIAILYDSDSVSRRSKNSRGMALKNLNMKNCHNILLPSCGAFHILLRVNIGWYMIIAILYDSDSVSRWSKNSRGMALKKHKYEELPQYFAPILWSRDIFVP